MIEILDVGAVAALWSIVLWRRRMIRGTQTQRSLWLALATLAVAQLFQLQITAQAFNQLLGLPFAATAVASALVILAAAHVLSMLDGLKVQLGGEPARVDSRRRGLAVVAVTAALSPFLVSRPEAGFTTDAGYYELSPTGLASLAGYLGYLGWALFAFTVMCWTYGRASTPGPVRTGLILGGVGTAIGLLHVAHKGGVVAGAAIWGPVVGTGDGTIQAATTGTCLLLCAAGSSYPALTAKAHELRRRRDTWRSLRRLHSLWVALCEASPEIALTPPTSRHRDAIVLTDMTWRLVRRVVEIRDGLLALRPYVTAQDRAAARQWATGTGLCEDQLSAAVAAHCLEAGRRAKLAGRRPTGGAPVTSAGGSDLAAERRWLEQLARAYALVRVDNASMPRRSTT